MSEQFEVLFDWEPENLDDLRLYIGEVIEVLEKNDHGWWLGLAIRDGSLHKGYFPKNYVKPFKPEEINLPKPPPRPLTLPKPVPIEDIKEALNDLNAMKIDDTASSFSLKSLDAFDELTNIGYTIEINDNIIIEKNNGMQQGSLVKIKCIAKIWDAASTKTKVFANCCLSFVIGNKQVTSGLDIAMGHLTIEQIATITCSPTWAYGTAGNPPHVPPNSYIVFEVEIISCTNDITTISNDEDNDTKVLLGSGIEIRKKKATNIVSNKRQSAVLLMTPTTNNTTPDTPSPIIITSNSTSTSSPMKETETEVVNSILDDINEDILITSSVSPEE